MELQKGVINGGRKCQVYSVKYMIGGSVKYTCQIKCSVYYYKYKCQVYRVEGSVTCKCMFEFISWLI